MIVKDVFNLCSAENVVGILAERYFANADKESPKERYLKIIDEIKNTEPTRHPETMCCVIKYWDIDIDDIEREYYDVCSVEKDTIKPFEPVDRFEDIQLKPFEEYCFMYEDRKDILGYQLNEVSLSRYGIDEVAAAIFWELTWFGYEYESQNKNRIREKEKLENPNDNDEIDIEDLEDDDDIDFHLDDKPYEISEKDKMLSLKTYNEEAEYWKEYFKWKIK